MLLLPEKNGLTRLNATITMLPIISLKQRLMHRDAPVVLTENLAMGEVIEELQRELEAVGKDIVDVLCDEISQLAVFRWW